MQRFPVLASVRGPVGKPLAEWMAFDLSKLDLLVQRVDAQAQAWRGRMAARGARGARAAAAEGRSDRASHSQLPRE